MQDGRKAFWSIQYISVAFFPSLKQNFIELCTINKRAHKKKVCKIIVRTLYL